LFCTPLNLLFFTHLPTRLNGLHDLLNNSILILPSSKWNLLPYLVVPTNGQFVRIVGPAGIECYILSPEACERVQVKKWIDICQDNASYERQLLLASPSRFTWLCVSPPLCVLSAVHYSFLHPFGSGSPIGGVSYGFALNKCSL
jgi:hypothetical protein